MTTTYTLNGTRIDYFDNTPGDDGTIVGTQDAVLTLTLDDAITSLSYTVDQPSGTDDDDATLVTFSEDILDGIALDGVDPQTFFDTGNSGSAFDDLEVEFSQINWSGGTSYLIGFYYIGFEDNNNFDEVEFLFTFGADLGFDLGSEAETEAFLTRELGANPTEAEIEAFLTEPTAPFAPNTAIPLTTFPWDSIVDNPDPVIPGIEVTGDNDGNDLDGSQGNDTVDAGRGDDTVDAGEGDDDVRAGTGDDSVDGGQGDDFLRGGRGEDTLEGGLGDDSIVGQRNADIIDGGDGDDNLKGGGGNDTIDGGVGNDFIKGGTRADSLDGGDGNDRIFANSFADVLNGNAGNDLLNAGGDADTLNGGTGNDTLKGGGGADTFIFDANMGADVVLDFEDDTDVLQISTALTGGSTDAAFVVSNFASVVAGNTVFDFGNGNTITLNGVGDETVVVDDITFF